MLGLKACQWGQVVDIAETAVTGRQGSGASANDSRGSVGRPTVGSGGEGCEQTAEARDRHRCPAAPQDDTVRGAAVRVSGLGFVRGDAVCADPGRVPEVGGRLWPPISPEAHGFAHFDPGQRWAELLDAGLKKALDDTAPHDRRKKSSIAPACCIRRTLKCNWSCSAGPGFHKGRPLPLQGPNRGRGAADEQDPGEDAGQGRARCSRCRARSLPLPYRWAAAACTRKRTGCS